MNTKKPLAVLLCAALALTLPDTRGMTGKNI